ncbi:MAG: putative esterase [Candidatus Paceibacteria bacterium]|jgi:predicted esterase
MFLLRSLTCTLLALANPLHASPQVVAGQQGNRISIPANSPCVLSGANHPMTFVIGAHQNNTLVTTGDPDTRRFLIFVPSSYQVQNGPYPAVYMLHGSGQTANNIQNNTSWSQAAEALGFILVYPEALPYLLQDGTTKTKWETAGTALAVDTSELPLADDELFLRELHNSVASHLSIDCDRVYASGFSNGGAFVKTRIRVDMPDLFAATTSGGGMGVHAASPSDQFPADGATFRPHFEVVGNQDANKLANCIDQGDLNPGDSLPRLVADIMATPCMWVPLTTMAAAIGMDPGSFVAVEQQNFTQLLWNNALLPGPGPTEYRFRVLPGLDHAYPSGNNHPIDYVPIFYMWMSQFAK